MSGKISVDSNKLTNKEQEHTMNTQPTASHFINGKYVEDSNGAPIDVIYPATGEIIARVYSATPDVIEQAVRSGLNAQKAWAKRSGTERGRILQRAASDHA